MALHWVIQQKSNRYDISFFPYEGKSTSAIYCLLSLKIVDTLHLSSGIFRNHKVLQLFSEEHAVSKARLYVPTWIRRWSSQFHKRRNAGRYFNVFVLTHSSLQRLILYGKMAYLHHPNHNCYISDFIESRLRKNEL